MIKTALKSTLRPLVLTVLFFSFLIFPNITLASVVSYSRDLGTTLISPVNFIVEVDDVDFSENVEYFCLAVETEIIVEENPESLFFYSDVVPFDSYPQVLNTSVVMDSGSVAKNVQLYIYVAGNTPITCGNPPSSTAVELEAAGGDTIFTIASSQASSQASNNFETVVVAVVGSTTSTITNVLVSNLPLIFIIFAGLLALYIIIRFVRRLVGSPQ